MLFVFVLCLVPSAIWFSVLYFLDCRFNFLYLLLTSKFLEFVMADVDKRHNIFFIQLSIRPLYTQIAFNQYVLFNKHRKFPGGIFSTLHSLNIHPRLLLKWSAISFEIQIWLIQNIILVLAHRIEDWLNNILYECNWLLKILLMKTGPIEWHYILRWNGQLTILFCHATRNTQGKFDFIVV